jgi:hypothetical protein
VVTAEQLAARRAEIARAPDLQALQARLVERAGPVLARLPVIPAHKALLSQDGGVCPDDGTALVFDPWSPSAHRCPRCGKTFTGERHDRHWAKFQHLWLAERAAHLAALAALGGHDAAAARATEILRAYGERYFRYPNRDNVLGPSRLFFSTYLESIWILNYLAAAQLLRAADRLDDATRRAVGQVADEAANLIGEHDEGFSNRQTWNNAALAAIGVWCEDDELLRATLEANTGLVEHLRGFRDDGMWYEGENYHLFALRGWLTGAGWARAGGVDVLADARVAERVRRALRAPAITALPDFTFPARKDSRFGISLAQPMYVELWEIGGARLGERGKGKGEEIANWLAALYRDAAPVTSEPFESYLHDAGLPPRTTPPAPRTELSWWSLLEMAPAVAGDATAWKPASELLASQGLAVLRAGGRYASLECGPAGGGHGHPDRLHLTLHAGGVHWLPDFGTGSYVSPELFWYRSTLAHNAPRLDGASQELAPAGCDCFDTKGDWAWVSGRFGDLRRVVVSGPRYVVDVMELSGRVDRLLELPWHFTGQGDVETPGRWETSELDDAFVTHVERFRPDAPGPIRMRVTSDHGRLTMHFAFDGQLLRAEGPGRPTSGRRETFYLERARGRNLRLVTVLDPAATPIVRAVRVAGDVIEVETPEGVDHHRLGTESWDVETAAGRVALRGARAADLPFGGFLELEPVTPPTAAALRIDAPPALDGTLAGFDLAEPLTLELEDQYRRAEEPYPGPEELAAVAYVNWDDRAVYLAVEVTKPDLVLRPADAALLRLDNEVDDIHSDGLQIYVRLEDAGAPVVGFLVVPDARTAHLRVRTTTDATGDAAQVRGAWRRTAAGYCVTLALPVALVGRAHIGARLGFDLLVNEMLPGRERRAGQLVWSGGNGWVWVRGDRQDPSRFGVLELIG